MIAFNNVNLVPMTGEQVINNQTVLVDDTEIIVIGPVNEVVIPEKAKIIDGEGAYLMPGLADMHVHVLRDKWPVSQLKLYLANGVTTIRSLGTTADEKDHRTNESLPFIGKAFSEQYDLRNFKDDAFQKDIRRKVSEIVNQLRFKNIPVHTTLYIFEDVDTRLLEGSDELLGRAECKYLPEEMIRELSQGKDWFIEYLKEFKEFWHFLFEVQKIFLVELNNTGVPLVLGTDAGIGILGIVPGYSVHDELRVLTESGLTPYQAIATSTVNASKVVAAMNGKDDFGTIKVGKRADFILVKKNPLEDVGNIKYNRGVMVAGRWYSKAKLQEMISLND